MDHALLLEDLEKKLYACETAGWEEFYV